MPSDRNSWTLTDAERQSYRSDAVDPERGRDLAVGRELSRALSEKTREEYAQFVEEVKRIFAEFARNPRPIKSERNSL